MTKTNTNESVEPQNMNKEFKKQMIKETRPRNAYMVDYKITSPLPRWVRMPFVSLSTATAIVWSLSNEHFSSHLQSFNTHLRDDEFKHFRFSSLRIHSEDELDELVNAQGKLIRHCGDGDDCEPTGTLRQNLFGGSYQSVADQMSGLSAKELGEWEEKRYPKWVELGALRTFEETLNDLRDIYPDGIDWEDYDAEQEQYAA